MDKLFYKWHHSKHDLPKQYAPITVETTEGRLINGYVTKVNRFVPNRGEDTSRLEKIVVRRWKYSNSNE